ncbi:MAG: hypothetical protein K2P14_10315 [Anaeroplasmataceae bacterium]|nr:hypothetical protein [Anaeroplasmataceae bacterium]
MIKFVKKLWKKFMTVDIYDIVIGPCFGAEGLTEEDIKELQEKIDKMGEK